MQKTVHIQNLKCGGCANTIITKVSLLEGVSDVAVDNENDLVQFNIETEELLDNVTNKLAQLGYPVVGDANSIVSKAKSFVSCAVGRIDNIKQ